MLFCLVSLYLVLILNKGSRNATFFKREKNLNTSIVLFYFTNLLYLLGDLIWANKVIRLYVYCPVVTSLAEFLW